ncbi:5-(carboxyamino)imidazole ribonucleotide synthase [Bacillus sp. 2205SS5-2]|uniref:5-(carboxyamino)imidazole ribonucleotide synthase n=1 Tax=Bacillus sp. 2205SS5-2 TaxID=3109031 RepID=UPI0030057CAC
MSLSRSWIAPGSTIGIIGGGQLGRMMALAAKEAGFNVIVLDPTKNSSCGQVADNEIVAAFDDRDALAQLAARCDVVTYEFENIDYDALCWLESVAHVPQGAELIQITQDRILEKQALMRAGVSVASFAKIRKEHDLYEQIERIGYPAVLKTTRGGYDGKGQIILREEKDLQSAMKVLRSGDCVLEEWISFEKEISVVLTRNSDGELTMFPVAENIHRQNILHESIVPARISHATTSEAYKLARKIAEHLGLIGTLAVEMFVNEDGSIYVNELAPRPHNSGHYTIEACETSQFAQHIRAICNWPLKSTALVKPAIMVNILGEHVSALMKEIPLRSDWSIHLYGKDEAKEKRKMGHVTILTNELEHTLDEINKSRVFTSFQESEA